MNAWIIGLGLVGLVLVFFELLVPGGILGLLGVLMLLGGAAMAFVEYGAGGGALVFLIFSTVTVAVLGLGLKFLPRTRLGGRFLLTDAIEGTSHKPPGDAKKDLIGSEGEALTMLAPTGLVRIDGKQYEAFSQSGFVNRGARVKVTDVDNFRVTVRKS